MNIVLTMGNCPKVVELARACMEEKENKHKILVGITESKATWKT
jgi:hypothetical protein